MYFATPERIIENLLEQAAEYNLVRPVIAIKAEKYFAFFVILINYSQIF